MTPVVIKPIKNSKDAIMASLWGAPVSTVVGRSGKGQKVIYFSAKQTGKRAPFHGTSTDKATKMDGFSILENHAFPHIAAQTGEKPRYQRTEACAALLKNLTKMDSS